MHICVYIHVMYTIYIDSRPGVTLGVTEEAWNGRWEAPEAPKRVSSRQFQVAGKFSVPTNAGCRQMQVAGTMSVPSNACCRQFAGNPSLPAT